MNFSWRFILSFTIKRSSDFYSIYIRSKRIRVLTRLLLPAWLRFSDINSSTRHKRQVISQLNLMNYILSCQVSKQVCPEASWNLIRENFQDFIQLIEKPPMARVVIEAFLWSSRSSLTSKLVWLSPHISPNWDIGLQKEFNKNRDELMLTNQKFWARFVALTQHVWIQEASVVIGDLGQHSKYGCIFLTHLAA